MTKKFTELQIDAITKAFVDEGKIIEAGWFGLKSIMFPNGAPDVQITEMRSAFFAGAQHLYTSILRALDPGDDPSEADLSRMGRIDAELREFIEDFTATHLKTDGNA